jgi:hypothetical protein
LIIKSGLEHWFFDGKFALRAGYISFVTIQGAFSLGASYRNSQWSVDYAFLNHGDSLGNNHRLGASWHFDTGKSQASPKPYIVDSLVGDEKIYLKWDIPSESQAEGYFIYIRSEQEKDFHRAHQEPLKANYCLLRGAKNGIRYHLVIRSIVNGKESFSCNEWVVSPRPISEEAKHYYESGLKYFHQNNLPTALFTIRKAEEIDPNNYDIKDLLHKLETNNHEGLVPEKPGN